MYGPEYSREQVVKLLNESIGSSTLAGVKVGDVVYYLTHPEHPELPAGEWIEMKFGDIPDCILVDSPGVGGWAWGVKGTVPNSSRGIILPNGDFHAVRPDKKFRVRVTPDPRVPELEAKVKELESELARDEFRSLFESASDEIVRLQTELAKAKNNLVLADGLAVGRAYQIETLESALARAEEAAKCWRLMTEYQRSKGVQYYTVGGMGSLFCWVEHRPSSHSTPEAAVLAVCEPKPEPVLTLGTAEPGRWVQPDQGVLHSYPVFVSPECGLLRFEQVVNRFATCDLPPMLTCHYIDDPRREVKK